MLLDSHVHFGKILDWNFTEEDVIKSMDKYNIDYAIISNLEGCEFNHKLIKINSDKQINQLTANKKTVDFVKKYPKKLKGLFWIKPHLEGYKKEVEEFIIKNRQYICGMKVHPFHSNMRFTVENYKDYLEMCTRLKLPISVHTDSSISDPTDIYNTAKTYPNLTFVLVHMGLGTDNLNSINYIKELPNLYGDTTWVKIDSVMKAIKECGSKKLLFGTDSIIDGVDTYNKYLEMITYLKENLTKQDFDNVFSQNAKKIFKL